MLAELSYWQQTTLRSVGILLAVLAPAGGFVYVFLFKMMSFMQSRLGPNEAGPYGSMQLLAEVGKWLQKEDITPERADRTATSSKRRSEAPSPATHSHFSRPRNSSKRTSALTTLGFTAMRV